MPKFSSILYYLYPFALYYYYFIITILKASFMLSECATLALKNSGVIHMFSQSRPVKDIQKF